MRQKGKKTKKKTRAEDKAKRPPLDFKKWSAARPLIPVFCLLILIALSIAGLERLKDHVYAQPEFSSDLGVRLVLSPDQQWVDDEGWRPHIESAIRLPDRASIIDRTWLADIADQMLRSGWVSRVDRVERHNDGTIGLMCRYRRPVAMVHVPSSVAGGDRYFAIDAEGYRLPEDYTNVDHSGYIQLRGIQSSMPEVGERFSKEGQDAIAAIRLGALLFQQPFGNQLKAVDVSNFNGRQSRRQSRIRIVPVCSSSSEDMIIWGSPIGEEFEENTVAEKLRLIDALLKEGAIRGRVDVSTYSNAVVEQCPEVVRISERLVSRNR